MIAVVDAGRLSAAPLPADGGERPTVLDACLDALTALALVADEVGDRFGAIAFDDEVRFAARPAAPAAPRSCARCSTSSRGPSSPTTSSRSGASRAPSARSWSCSATCSRSPPRARSSRPCPCSPAATRWSSPARPTRRSPRSRPPRPRREGALARAAVALEVRSARARAAALVRGAGAQVLEAPASRLPSALRRRLPAGEAAGAAVAPANVNGGWVGRRGSRPRRPLRTPAAAPTATVLNARRRLIALSPTNRLLDGNRRGGAAPHPPYPAPLTFARPRTTTRAPEQREQREAERRAGPRPAAPGRSRSPRARRTARATARCRARARPRGAPRRPRPGRGGPGPGAMSAQPSRSPATPPTTMHESSSGPCEEMSRRNAMPLPAPNASPPTTPRISPLKSSARRCRRPRGSRRRTRSASPGCC